MSDVDIRHHHPIIQHTAVSSQSSPRLDQGIVHRHAVYNTFMIQAGECICIVVVSVFLSGPGHWAPPQVIGHDGHRYQRTE